MNTSSFLPEDYLAQKAERRTNIIILTLFVVVIAAVLGAFLVTNRQWNQLKNQQATINTAYLQAGEELEELNELETQKDEMLRKAEIVSALVERVPRSILLAELINRMPDRLGLIEFELNSKKIKAVVVGQTPKQTGRHKGPTRGLTKQEAEDVIKKVEAPQFKVVMSMVGLAPTDLEVSRYLAALNTYTLLNDVSLLYSEEKEFDGQVMREFKITMDLSRDADFHHVDPLLMPRGMRNPMDDNDLNLGRSTAAVGNEMQEN